MKGGIYPTKYGYQVRFGRKLTKHFKSLQEAERFLTGIRYESDRGTFDIRDYQKDNPLGFANLVNKFLYSKRLLKGVKKYEQRLRFATDTWGNRNIKAIGFADVENLIIDLTEQGLSSKYIKDIRDCIKMFYRWLWKTGELTYDQIPQFPTVKAHMEYRNIVDKATQDKILAEVKRITQFNPRIHIGIKWLATYINVRPGEIIHIRERDIDLSNGRIVIDGKFTKTGESKFIFLLESDISALSQFNQSFGNLYFFRHTSGRGGNPRNSRFGKGYLYNYWKRACENLGIRGVDLYGGTRHSSAVDLRRRHSPESVKRATQHGTNEAFERYLQVTGDELRGLYADTRSNKPVINIVDYEKSSNSKK